MTNEPEWRYPLEQLATDFRAHAQLDEVRFGEVRTDIRSLGQQIARVVAIGGVAVTVAIPLITELVHYVLGLHVKP